MMITSGPMMVEDSISAKANSFQSQYTTRSCDYRTPSPPAQYIETIASPENLTCSDVRVPQTALGRKRKRSDGRTCGTITHGFDCFKGSVGNPEAKTAFQSAENVSTVELLLYEATPCYTSEGIEGQSAEDESAITFARQARSTPKWSNGDNVDYSSPAPLHPASRDQTVTKRVRALPTASGSCHVVKHAIHQIPTLYHFHQSGIAQGGNFLGHCSSTDNQPGGKYIPSVQDAELLLDFSRSGHNTPMVGAEAGNAGSMCTTRHLRVASTSYTSLASRSIKHDRNITQNPGSQDEADAGAVAGILPSNNYKTFRCVAPSVLRTTERLGPCTLQSLGDSKTSVVRRPSNKKIRAKKSVAESRTKLPKRTKLSKRGKGTSSARSNSQFRRNAMRFDHSLHERRPNHKFCSRRSGRPNSVEPTTYGNDIFAEASKSPQRSRSLDLIRNFANSETVNQPFTVWHHNGMSSKADKKVLDAATIGVAQANYCTICKSVRTGTSAAADSWIGCSGCESWLHQDCAGFLHESDVRGIGKFYCKTCEPKFGRTTFVRKSNRPHASLDYQRLHEGKVMTSVSVPDHHYIKPIKEGKWQFQPESFPRIRPELLTADFLQKTGMSSPIVVPAAWNPRPDPPTKTKALETVANDSKPLCNESIQLYDHLEYECVPNDGQDLLDMAIPGHLSVRRVMELYGAEEKIEVINVKSQEGEERRWDMKQWVDYYENDKKEVVKNVISLEVSQSKLGRIIRRPKVVRDLDLQVAVWPKDEKAMESFPRVQLYCLMSVADCYTDFHIDFGGSSVYYHILKGKKTFFFIPPKKQHLKKYEDWCNSAVQNNTFLGDETKECYRVDLFEGDTMLIPSGWIHAVWTPENSLVIGGNFLTRLHYGMQIQVNEIEKATGVARKFRYPFFQKILWGALIDYLGVDPIPATVVDLLCSGRAFPRYKPIFQERPEAPDSVFDEESTDYVNARYYSQAEVEGFQDLLDFCLRTVLISQGCISTLNPKSRDAVSRSLPKGYGDHGHLVKVFAAWVAWKKGNECLPIWASSNSPLSSTDNFSMDKKATTACARKRDRSRAAPTVQAERRSSRQIRRILPGEAEPPALHYDGTVVCADSNNNLALDVVGSMQNVPHISNGLGYSQSKFSMAGWYGVKSPLKSCVFRSPSSTGSQWSTTERVDYGYKIKSDDTKTSSTFVAVVVNQKITPEQSNILISPSIEKSGSDQHLNIEATRSLKDTSIGLEGSGIVGYKVLHTCKTSIATRLRTT